MRFSINIPVIIATIINFLILIAVMKKFLFKPINNIIDARKSEIENSILKAEKDKEEAEKLRKESEELNLEAKMEGKSIVEIYKVKAEKVSKEILDNAHEEAQNILSRAKREIEIEKEKAEAEIKAEAINLAIELSKKVLEESIDEAKHRKMIEDFIAKVGS